MFDYALVDFIPFTAQIYLRVVERTNLALGGTSGWIATLPTLVLSLILACAHRWLLVRPRFLMAISALLAAGSVNFFFVPYYWPLHAAVAVAIGAFGVQILLAVMLTLIQTRTRMKRDDGFDHTERFSALQRGSRVIGVSLLALSLLWPLITIPSRFSTTQWEWTGVHPDPTAVWCLGVSLLLAAGWQRWLFGVIPLLWCLVSAAVLSVLEFTQWLALICVAMVWLGVMLATSVSLPMKRVRHKIQ